MRESIEHKLDPDYSSGLRYEGKKPNKIRFFMHESFASGGWRLNENAKNLT